MDIKTLKYIIACVYKKNTFGEIKLNEERLFYRFRYLVSKVITNSSDSINTNDFIKDCKVWLYNNGYNLKEEALKVVLTDLNDNEIYIIKDETKQVFCQKRILDLIEYTFANFIIEKKDKN